MLNTKSMCIRQILHRKAQTSTRICTLLFFTNTIQPTSEKIVILAEGENLTSRKNYANQS